MEVQEESMFAILNGLLQQDLIEMILEKHLNKEKSEPWSCLEGEHSRCENREHGGPEAGACTVSLRNSKEMGTNLHQGLTRSMVFCWSVWEVTSKHSSQSYPELMHSVCKYTNRCLAQLLGVLWDQVVSENLQCSPFSGFLLPGDLVWSEPWKFLPLCSTTKT